MTDASERLYSTLIASLYADALVLADEARAWFDRALIDRGRVGPNDALNKIDPSQPLAGADGDDLFRWAGRHDPSLRITLSCESLRLTTRLMHIIAWLLLQRAITAGEVDPKVASEARNRIGISPPGDAALRAQMPVEAQRLIAASERLHQRVAQLDAGLDKTNGIARPVVLEMLGRLQSAL